jgi:hypothetical protein
MPKDKNKVRATLVYEDITARYMELQQQEEKANERKLRFVLENNRDLYLYNAEGKRLWNEKGEGWHIDNCTATDENAYCSLEKRDNHRSWEYWGYKVQGADAKGKLCCEKELTEPTSVFTLGGYVFLLNHSGMLVKCDLYLNEFAHLGLAPHASKTRPHGKEMEPGVSFCLPNGDGSLTIVNYIKMQSKVIPCPMEFQLGTADSFGYLYGTNGMSFKTVTALDQTGEIVAGLRIKGNLTHQNFFLRDGYAHVWTSTVGIFEYTWARPEKTITRIYRMEPV